MKKLFIAGAVAVAALAATTSCNNSSTEENSGLTDSLSTTFGQVNGIQLSSQYQTVPEAEKAKLDKDQILAGIKTILMADTANHGYMAGLQLGMGLQGNIMQFEAQGVKMDRKKVYDAFAAAFKTDSVSPTQVIELQGTLSTLLQRATAIGMAEAEAKAEQARAARAETPEAKANIEAGTKFVEAEKAKYPDMKTTASGVSYRVTAPGTGDATPTTSDIVKVKYTGKLVDGTVFDTSDGEVVEFPVDRLIPGFTEALTLMKKGEKMTVYIPGSLAYGVEGTPDGKIGPMATLVFDIELVDFNSAK